jgi:DNA-binding response OmpR family regulator
MKIMQSILLVFDDQKELEFIESNLIESGFHVSKTDNLKVAVKIAERIIPDLVVVNTFNSEYDLKLFSEQIKTERLKNTSLLSLIELEDYLKTSSREHFIVKPVRPKLLLSLIRSVMNNEEIKWLPSFH